MEVNNLRTNRRAQIGNITIPLLKGEQGYSISRIVRTSGDGGAGSIDTYTVYIDTDPETAIGTFQVVNGTGGDMSKNVYDIDNDDIVDRATGDGNGNEITATYETIENVTALASRVATLEQAGYITKSVADLANYYLKSETYTKQEVNNLCDMIPKFAIEVVSVLPTQDISETTIYLLRDDEETQDVYQEYIYVNNTWERIGGQRIDLSNYYQKSEVDNLLNDKADTSDLDSYYTKNSVDGLLNQKINTNDIIDNLTSTNNTKVLSAKQGKALKDLLDINNNNIANESTERVNADNLLQSQITSLSSGSPLVASSISEMTDTTKIYVNTTDGKWYYYDGDSWKIGGTYQSSGIADNSINPEKLNKERFSSAFKFYENNLKPISTSWQSGAYSNGKILANVNAISCMNVSLKAGDVISLVGEFELCIFKGNTRLRYYSKADYTISTDGDDYAFIIVKNPREDITQYVNSAKSIVGISNYDAEFTDITYDNLDINLKNSIDATIGEFTLDSNSNWKSGYYNTYQEYIVASGYSTSQPIKVKKGYKLKSNVNGANTVYTLFKCNQDGTLIEGLKTGTGNNPIDFNYDITFDGYIGASYRNVGIPNVYVTISKTVENLQNQIDKISEFNLYDNSLIGCNYVSEGDSITNRNGKASGGWSASTGYTPYETPVIIGYQNYVVNKLNCNLTNYGAEGYTIVNMLESILNRDYSNVDLVTIAFGVNDARTGVVLGVLGGYSDTSFDITTFTGAYRTAINHMLEDNPNIKIILMTPIQRDYINGFGTDTPNINGDTLVNFRNRIIEIAKIYSLPVSDSFSESEINNYNIKSLTIDGVHPNNAGYKCIGKLLCNTINKL